MKIKVTSLENLISKILIKYGHSKHDSEVIKKSLMYAQLRGNNQGIVKLIGNSLVKNIDAKPLEIIKQTKMSTVLNGNSNMGMVVMQKAVDMAIYKATNHGFGIVAVNNTSTSTGAIGYFANKIATNNLLGFVFAGSPETVSTYGGYQPLFGTNPLAIGLPTENEPVVLDMATAAMAWFGLVEAKTAKKKIPADVAYDVKGKKTTDPNKAMEGSILPFDRSYKGAGLSMIIEALTGPLVGASFVGIGDANNWGNLVYAIDPELLVEIDEFKKNMSNMIATIKSSKKLDNVDSIFVPGERGNKMSEAILKSGEIEIEDNLYNEIAKIVKE